MYIYIENIVTIAYQMNEMVTFRAKENRNFINRIRHVSNVIKLRSSIATPLRHMSMLLNFHQHRASVWLLPGFGRSRRFVCFGERIHFNEEKKMYHQLSCACNMLAVIT